MLVLVIVIAVTGVELDICLKPEDVYKTARLEKQQLHQGINNGVFSIKTHLTPL